MCAIRCRTLLAGAAATALFSAAGTALARVCHPDPAGTRVLVIHGDVFGYTMRSAHVRLAYATAAGCVRIVSWNVVAASRRRSVDGAGVRRCTSERPGFGDMQRVPTQLLGRVLAFDGRQHAVVNATTISIYSLGRLVSRFPRATSRTAQKAVLRGSVLIVLDQATAVPDRPPRLDVYDVPAGRLLHAWPLVNGADTLDLADGIALFSAVNHHGLYALRLQDGRVAFLAPALPGDTPQIEPLGVVYQDATFDRDRRAHRVPVKFVPMSAVKFDLTALRRTLSPPGRVTGLAMDGPSISYSFRPARGCDQVVIWQALWNDIARPTMEGGPSCPHATGNRIDGLALGGITAQWVSRLHGVTNLVTASSKNCMQRLLMSVDRAAGDRIDGLAADRNLFAYVVARADGSARLNIANVGNPLAPITRDLADIPRAVAVEGRRVVILHSAGNVDVLSADGELITSIATPPARAIALRGGTLALLTSGRLVTYDLMTATVIHSWHVPAGTSSSIDVHFGIAVITAGRNVDLVRLEDGKLVRLVRAPAPALARIDEAGVAYASSPAGRGVVTFVPMSDVARAIARG